ncbi:peptidoglycan editing factor PgeF [Pseudoxanthomonas dokdonensis]|uniref:Purine nucleoside phosphorylase n=1 Tax=Pseudoxanthomonas dokdonensis TaxID=344882 RepID=A0A0R0CX78_9GAMM|nr:peptidoglycan editing factor PgeF [Pseudoxanthomonas dokdonensis]KRG69971.1 laccase [Pseudoxanthomonas dokdonensis]
MSHPVVQLEWPAPANVHAFTTLRHGGGSSEAPFDSFNLGARCGDDAQAWRGNRAELIERYALPSAPRWLQQVHGTRVLVEPGDDEPEADAAVTRTAGTVLAILTADCLPVVLASDDGRAVAAAHAGWRGLAAGVLENTVAAMDCDPAHQLAWLGPAAGPGAYEVGQEVLDAFIAAASNDDAVDAVRGAFVATRPGHWRVDLYALARQRLALAGVTRVYGGGLCTISQPGRFFSHRRDQRTGRMATLVWMQ